MDNLATLEIAIRKEFTGFEIIQKSSSFKMKAIDLFLKVITFWRMKTFMVDFVTTVGEKVYVPAKWAKWPEKNKMIILRHERVHMRQARKYTRPLFSFLYLFFPLPGFLAYYRTKFEREAYEESMRATFYFYGGHVLDGAMYRRDMINHFTTAEYFWMWPWGGVERWYDETVRKIRKESHLPG